MAKQGTSAENGDAGGSGDREDGAPNLGALHDDATVLHPERVALIDGESGEQVTYREVGERIARAGNALGGLGVERGDRVALFAPNELWFVYAFFGACRIGSVPLPLNIELPLDTLEYIVADSGAEVVVTSERPEVCDRATAVAEAVDGVGTLAVTDEEPGLAPDGTAVVSFTQAVADAATVLAPAPVSDDDPAMQTYTSGSTGTPKGVVLTHGGTHWNVTTIRQVHFLDRHERAIVAGPLYHKNALVGAVKPLFQAGGSVVVMDGFDSSAVIAAIDEYDVTYLRGVPAMYKLLVADEAALAAHDVSSVEWAVSGSASLPEALITSFEEAFGAPMGEAYGLTETGGPVTLSPRWGPRKQGSSGLPLPGAELRIVDPDSGEELPGGETGEVIVASPGNGRYYGRPEVEAEAYEERDGRRFLHTDDLAYRDDQGYVYIAGRLDDMLVVGGENVYPAEVEALLQEHEAVDDVAVVGVPHAMKGEAPVAFVVAEGVTEDDLKQFFIERGPAYAHPRRVFFEVELPLSGTGKVDRDALEADARERIGGAL